MATVTPPGSRSVPCASTGLPRLIEARRTPAGAKSAMTAAVGMVMGPSLEAATHNGAAEYAPCGLAAVLSVPHLQFRSFDQPGAAAAGDHEVSLDGGGKVVCRTATGRRLKPV